MSRTSVLSQKFGAEPRGPKRVDAAVHEPSAYLLRAKHHAHRETIERSEINSGELLTQTLVLCSQSLFRFADLGDDGLCRGGPDKGCGVIVSAIDVVVDRLD